MRKNSTLKKVIAVSLFASLSISLTACSGNSTSGTQSTPTSASEPASTSTSSTAASSSSAAENSSEPSSTPDNSSAANESSASSEPYTLGGELTDEMIKESRYNEGNKVRLAKVIKKLQANEEVTVAYIGGSITQGISAGEDDCYARLTTNWLEKKFPNAKINYVNAGIGATGSVCGMARADTDVIEKNPDLVFVEFSVNDTTENTELNKEAYATLLRKLWAAPTSPAIVTIAMTQENGTSFQEYHGEIIKMFDLPMISYKNTILKTIANGYITWDDISNDNIHPNVPGHALLSDLITNYLQSVIDDVDNISGDESNFNVDSELGNKYLGYKFLTVSNYEPKTPGCFVKAEAGTNKFGAQWFVMRKGGQFTDEDAIEFEFEGTEAAIMLGKLTKYGTKCDIYVDGKLVTTLDGALNKSITSYTDFEVVATGLAEGKHTLKIAPQSLEPHGMIYISAVAYK